jgi:hypothetical protein
MEEVPQKKRSPWLYVGLGCLAAIVLSCGALFAVGAGLVTWAKGWGEEMADPARRGNKARREAEALLGGVPEGYHAAFSFGVPMVFSTVQFIDAPIPLDGGVPEFTRQLSYMQLMETDQSKELRDFFDEKKAGGSLNSDNLQVDTKEELGRGVFQHQGRDVRWVSLKGRVRQQGGKYDQGDGVVTMMLFDCPKDGNIRVMTWLMQEPEGGTAELTGTVADPKEIEKLLKPLSPCGR